MLILLSSGTILLYVSTKTPSIKTKVFWHLTFSSKTVDFYYFYNSYL